MTLVHSAGRCRYSNGKLKQTCCHNDVFTEKCARRVVSELTIVLCFSWEGQRVVIDDESRIRYVAPDTERRKAEL
jgi:hypothetical protein